jgi:hypothetical protein
MILSFIKKLRFIDVFGFLLLAILVFQSKNSIQLISKSKKSTQEIEKLLNLFPEKNYQLVHDDLKTIRSELKDQKTVIVKGCEGFDEFSYSFPLALDTIPYTPLLLNESPILTCKKDSELSTFQEKYQSQKESQFFILWRLK